MQINKIWQYELVFKVNLENKKKKKKKQQNDVTTTHKHWLNFGAIGAL